MKKYAAEFMGTAILVFCGVGAAMVTVNVVAGALGFGLALVALCFAIGPISGCHVNPAVSLAMCVNRRMDVRTMLLERVCENHH
jgi:aquaporin Z